MFWQQQSFSDYIIPISLAIGVTALQWAYREVRTRRAQSWPVVDGTVEWSLTRVEGYERYQRTYHEVYYSYHVQGEYYSGIHQVDSESDYRHFPKGSRVLVHNKPSDPWISFLDSTMIGAKEEADD